MNKILTIFERDWDGNRKVIDRYSDCVTAELLSECIATEKVDGTNVRLTVRNHTLVRLEKRRNPSKIEKAKGIVEPWYVDGDELDQSDKWIWDAARNTDLSDIPDGEWSGEANGQNIQGNPLNMVGNRVMLFSLGKAPAMGDVPIDFEGLKQYFPRESLYGSGDMEGIVWHHADGRMFKIKAKDF
ncbi:MAG: hypothetical protein ABJA67_14985 [Chthonomonadales bacterium]